MQLALNQIPSNIDTVEKLVVWAVMLLDNQIGTLQIKEEENLLPVYATQVQIVRVADESRRIICRVSLPIDEAYSTNNTVKFWQHTRAIANTTIPTGFLSN